MYVTVRRGAVLVFIYYAMFGCQSSDSNLNYELEKRYDNSITAISDQADHGERADSPPIQHDNLPDIDQGEPPKIERFAQKPWNLIPLGHGAWVYDDFFNEVNTYNNKIVKNRIKNIYLLGGEVLVNCQETGSCIRKDFDVQFYASAVLMNRFRESAEDIKIVPTLDGNVGSNVLGEQFNRLNDQQALWLALEVGAAYCAEDIPGIQVDIEPYQGNTADGKGQLLFYKYLANVLVGENDGYNDAFLKTPIACVTKKYPKGRFFSVFMSANKVHKELVEILEKHNNGYIEVSGYDITPRDVSFTKGDLTLKFSSPLKYKSALISSINSIKDKNVPYKIGLPFSASWGEFEKVNTNEGSVSGFPQIEYIDAAIEAIHETGICKDINFLGIAVWAFSKAYGFTDNQTLEPHIAQPDALERLSGFSCPGRDF